MTRNKSEVATIGKVGLMVASTRHFRFQLFHALCQSVVRPKSIARQTVLAGIVLVTLNH